jgi:hypothetical protein
LANVNSNVGSFTNASITVNAKGLITSASTGAGGGTVTQINTGTNLTGGPITTTGTISTIASPTFTHVISGGAAPSISGSNLGTGGSVNFNGTPHDESGSFSVIPGLGATGTFVTITFGTAYSSAPNIVVSPGGSAPAALVANLYVSNTSTTSFQVTLGNLSATITYTYYYIVKQ